MIPTTLQDDAEKFATFILANYPDSKEWLDPVEKAAWYISHGFVAVVCCECGEIKALVAARPVDRPGIGVLPYYFNENGRCMHVDLLLDVSDDKRAMNALELFFRMRFPQCTTIAMFRHFEEHIRTYEIEKFWRSFHKLKRRKKKEKQHELAAT
jgi:hypothetical protein